METDCLTTARQSLEAGMRELRALMVDSQNAYKILTLRSLDIQDHLLSSLQNLHEQEQQTPSKPPLPEPSCPRCS